MQTVDILWDSSRLWGILAWRALRDFGLRARLVSAKQIAQGTCLGKQTAILLVPGGNARQKACALGKPGIRAIQDWVASGGVYFGICGGAGLALTHDSPAAGLSLCPWRRKAYSDRLLHLISGHVLASINGESIPLPVWWPGRFQPVPGQHLKILASYEEPGADLWLMDARLPAGESRERLSARIESRGEPVFPKGQPLVVQGRCQRGHYLLSYAHPETPGSLPANAWLCALLESYGCKPGSRQAQIWSQDPDCHTQKDGPERELHAAHLRLFSLLHEGEKLGLFFPRTEWLRGWRQGMPGIICNHLMAELALLGEMELSAESLDLWEQSRAEKLLNVFLQEAGTFFRRFHLGGPAPKGSDQKMLDRERDRVFGHPMLGGGMAENLLLLLEAMILQSQPD